MTKATYGGPRFGVKAHEVPGDYEYWAVVDAGFTLSRTGQPRIVAVCLDRREATAIASFLNDDLEGGRRLFKDCLSQLDHA